jgi:signal peptidase I
MIKVLTFMLGAFLLLTGCNENPPLQDETTKYDLPLFDKIDESKAAFEMYYDGMYRGQEQFSAYSKLVVDTNFYDHNAVSRGDIVYLKTTPEEMAGGKKEYDVLRVVGLPGESVTVKKGQVYINDRQLDTFYGKQNYNGAFINGTDKGLTLTKKVNVPKDHFIVAGDVWWRSGFYDTPIPKEKIRGKVVGWLKLK